MQDNTQGYRQRGGVGTWITIVAIFSVAFIVAFLWMSRNWFPLRGDALKENPMDRATEAALRMSDDAILSRLRDLREPDEVSLNKSVPGSPAYFETIALSAEILRRMHAEPVSAEKFISVFGSVTELVVETERKIPIVVGANYAVNVTVWVYPPLPLEVSGKDDTLRAELSAKLNGEDIQEILFIDHWRHDSIGWFKFQIRSDKFNLGENALSVQAHVRTGTRSQEGFITPKLTWDTPVINKSLWAEAPPEGELIKVLQNSDDLVAMERNARASLEFAIMEERLLEVKFEIPALSSPLCAIVSIGASDGSWPAKERLLLVPAQNKSTKYLMALFGENIRLPLEETLHVDVKLRPALQEAIWNDMPEIAGMCVQWNDLRINASQKSNSAGKLPIRVSGECP